MELSTYLQNRQEVSYLTKVWLRGKMVVFDESAALLGHTLGVMDNCTTMQYNLNNIIMLRKIILTSLYSLQIIGLQLYSQNNPVAFAYPMESINIDGDLSDWPDNIQKNNIDYYFYGSKVHDEKDYRANFQVGYDNMYQKLYLAIEIYDDYFIVDSSNSANWDNQDGISIYLNKYNSVEGSGVIGYSINNDLRYLIGIKDSWDPKVKYATMNDIDIAISYKNSKLVYEARIFLGDSIKEGQTIGFDLTIVDKDLDDKPREYTYIGWGSNNNKDSNPHRLGTIVLMNSNEKIGNTYGKISWREHLDERLVSRVILKSTKNNSRWFLIDVDSTGMYKACIPKGSYTCSSPYLQWGNKTVYRIDENTNIKVKSRINNTIENEEFRIPTNQFDYQYGDYGILHHFVPKDTIDIDHLIKKNMDFYSIPGVSLAIIHNNKIVYCKSFGYKNAYTKEKVNENTQFEAASITKVILAFIVQRFVEKGLIDLDKPLYEYLPYERLEHDERYKLLTARLVLSHQSGLPNWGSSRLEFDFTPGTKFGYSGEGIEYLAKVVERIVNKKIEDIIKDEVLIPMNMSNTCFSLNTCHSDNMALGHFSNLTSKSDIPNQPGMAYSMYTDAKSFANFMINLLNKKHLSENTYKEMFKPHVCVPDSWGEPGLNWDKFYSLGFYLMKSEYGIVIGHGGNNGDFKCNFELYLDKGFGYVVFANNNYGDKLNTSLRKLLIAGQY